MGKNQDPGSVINNPDLQHCYFCLMMEGSRIQIQGPKSTESASAALIHQLIMGQRQITSRYFISKQEGTEKAKKNLTPLFL
jgi:hypothetical protein